MKNQPGPSPPRPSRRRILPPGRHRGLCAGAMLCIASAGVLGCGFVAAGCSEGARQHAMPLPENVVGFQVGGGGSIGVGAQWQPWIDRHEWASRTLWYLREAPSALDKVFDDPPFSRIPRSPRGRDIAAAILAEVKVVDFAVWQYESHQERDTRIQRLLQDIEEKDRGETVYLEDFLEMCFEGSSAQIALGVELEGARLVLDYLLRPDVDREAFIHHTVRRLREKPAGLRVCGQDPQDSPPYPRGQDFWAAVLAQLNGVPFDLLAKEGLPERDRRIKALLDTLGDGVGLPGEGPRFTVRDVTAILEMPDADPICPTVIRAPWLDAKAFVSDALWWLYNDPSQIDKQGPPPSSLVGRLRGRDVWAAVAAQMEGVSFHLFRDESDEDRDKRINDLVEEVGRKREGTVRYIETFMLPPDPARKSPAIELHEEGPNLVLRYRLRADIGVESLAALAASWLRERPGDLRTAHQRCDAGALAPRGQDVWAALLAQLKGAAFQLPASEAESARDARIKVLLDTLGVKAAP